MLWRYGAPPWPTYPLGAYAALLHVSTVIFITAFYFGGLYEREPRLGGAAVLPRAARLSLAAGSFVALLNLALTGLAQPARLADPAGPAVPHPEPRRRHRPRRRSPWRSTGRSSTRCAPAARDRRGSCSPVTRPTSTSRAGTSPPSSAHRLVVVAEVDEPHAVVEVAREAPRHRRAPRDRGLARRVVPAHHRPARPAQRHDAAARHRPRDALRPRPAARGRRAALRPPAAADDADLAAALQAPARPLPPRRHRSRVARAARRCRALPARRRRAPADVHADAGRRRRRALRDGQVPHHAPRRRGRRRGPAVDEGRPARHPGVPVGARDAGRRAAPDPAHPRGKDVRRRARARSAPSSRRASRRRSPATPAGTRCRQA